MGVACYHSTKVRAKNPKHRMEIASPIGPQFRGGRHHNYDPVLDTVERLDENEVPDPISKLDA